MRRFAGCYVILVFALITVLRISASESIVKISSGVISGVSSNDGMVVSYKGVPYAAAPVAELRWRAPKPATPWKGVFKADHFGANCMQGPNNEFGPWTKEFLYRGPVSEDCLFLNVWTPLARAKAELPVLFFIHGGGFQAGSGNVEVYDGEALARMGMVVVTINYRVGVFGFFAHPELSAESPRHSSGNYGLLDQIAALRWVKENIGAFAGDPNRVTIAGQSAGAFSVRDLVASPLAKGLFRGAIADSGIGISGSRIPDLVAAENIGTKFAESAKARSVRDLRAIPAKQLLSMGGHFSPIVDGWMLPADPNDLAAAGKDSDVPVMTGWQADDARSLSKPVASVAEFEERARRIYESMADEFLKLYPAEEGDQLRKAETESTRDRERVSMFVWATRRAKNHKSSLFTYYFDRAIPWPQHPEFGAFHTGEIPYVFKTLKTMDRPFQPVDFKVSDLASEYWKNFVASSNPNSSDLPHWLPVDAKTPMTMRIGAQPGPMTIADETRLDFWLRYFNSPESENAPTF